MDTFWSGMFLCVSLLLISVIPDKPKKLIKEDIPNSRLKMKLCFADNRDWENQDLNHFCRGTY